MIGVVALFAGFVIEAVVVVIVVLIANLWKVCTCFCFTKLHTNVWLVLAAEKEEKPNR